MISELVFLVVQDEIVSFKPTPFEGRLEAALDTGVAEAYSMSMNKSTACECSVHMNGVSLISSVN